MNRIFHNKLQNILDEHHEKIALEDLLENLKGVNQLKIATIKNMQALQKEFIKYLQENEDSLFQQEELHNCFNVATINYSNFKDQKFKFDHKFNEIIEKKNQSFSWLEEQDVQNLKVALYDENQSYHYYNEQLFANEKSIDIILEEICSTYANQEIRSLV